MYFHQRVTTLRKLSSLGFFSKWSRFHEYALFYKNWVHNLTTGAHFTWTLRPKWAKISLSDCHSWPVYSWSEFTSSEWLPLFTSGANSSRKTMEKYKKRPYYAQTTSEQADQASVGNLNTGAWKLNHLCLKQAPSRLICWTLRPEIHCLLSRSIMGRARRNNDFKHTISGGGRLKTWKIDLALKNS